MKVYLKRSPRSVALVEKGHLLILRDISTLSNGLGDYTGAGHHHHADKKDSQPPHDKNYQPRCIVELVPSSALNWESYKEITSQTNLCHGCLGLTYYKGHTFIGLITGQKEVGSVKPGDTIYKIVGVDFICLNTDEFDVANGFSNDVNSSSIVNSSNPGHDSGLVATANGRQVVHPCHSIRKILSGGGFFHSNKFDITSTLQGRGGINNLGALIEYNDYDTKFMWNGYMNQELIEFRNRLNPLEKLAFDGASFLTSIVRGFAKTVNTTVGDDDLLFTVIAKQSCQRSGKLFGAFGVDDDGFVLNFMETEAVLYTERFCFSYIQIRGNVPIFWQLQNLLTSTKIEFPRSSDATMHSFLRHFDKLVNQYREIHVVTLLNGKGNQGELKLQYSKLLHKSGLLSGGQVKLDDVEFSTDQLKHNYGAMLKVAYLLEDLILEFGLYCYDFGKSEDIGKQSGVFYTNSFDSLDKATLVQKIISKELFQLSLRALGSDPSSDFWDKHNLLWKETGDYLTRLTNSSISNKSNSINSKGGLIGAVLGVSKKYITATEFAKTKEHAMDKLLGRLQSQVEVKLHDPIHDFISSELLNQLHLYSSQKEISIFCGTFNINGVLFNEDVSSWLFPKDSHFQLPPDLVVVGLEEVVELTAGQMLDTDKTNRLFWEKKLKRCLNARAPYNLVWGGQLGGILLLLFLKVSETKYINNVAGSLRKTGLGGMGSNKGAVAVSFTFSSTKFCIVVSHLAAGLNNVDERHQDYKNIMKNLRFHRNKTIKEHDAIIWMGDFNFRISLGNEVVRELVAKRQYAQLFDNDQLNNQMAAGESFPYFDEMEITFPPTYKFDNGTSNYDTSEKLRVPLWTDRIVSLDRKGVLKQVTYNSCQDILFSDHRPVYGEFFAKVTIENEKVKLQLALELYERRKLEIGDVNDLITASYLNELTLTHGFPPPSSDKRKWWIDGQPVKVTFPDLKPGKYVNPRLPVNPFEETDEPDFVTVSEIEGVNGGGGVVS